ncbi:MAG TPA: ATP-binding protein [Balneolaceae bacterium]|nr:ATP-binding protein [Balneolaceae bacterium]
MNNDLQAILTVVERLNSLDEEDRSVIINAVKSADKKLSATESKLQETEKSNRETKIRLEEATEELEHKRKAVKESRAQLQQSYKKLEAVQEQLVQQEKLASLGQLTAGIAHEIKNPLNFVNNFSDLSLELIEETKEELSTVSDQLSAVNREKVDEALAVLNDIEMNLKKIHEHGSRADSIVKSMLEHSRSGSGKMDPTDLNNLVKEFVNLTFHGMRAGKEPINVDLIYELDETISDVPLVAEDFSRVIVNLCNNAFDAMREKLNSESRIQNSVEYKPKLMIRTRCENLEIILEIEDNGPGIPDGIIDKIMQPFFTTKKGTQGTGLGLSITNDIIKAHGGRLELKSSTGIGTIFAIKLGA